MPQVPGLRQVFSNKSLPEVRSSEEDLSSKVKGLEEKLERMAQDFEDGSAIQAAFAAGRAPSTGMDDTSFALPRGGVGFTASMRSAGLSEEYVEALMSNLVALDGLNAGDLARRMDRMEGLLEEVLEHLRGPRAMSMSTGSLSCVSVPMPPPQEPPALRELRSPEPALAVIEEGPNSARSAEGRLRKEKEEMEEPCGRLLEVSLQRDSTQPSWGLLWDRKCFEKKTRVIEAVVPQSPVGLWNQERQDKGEDFLQRGDELVKLNGKSGWEACSDLSNLNQVQLVFRRLTDQEKQRSRRQASGSECRSQRFSPEASLRKRPGSASFTSLPRQAVSSGASGASLPHIPVPDMPELPARPSTAPSTGRPDVKGLPDRDQSEVQVLQAALQGSPGQSAPTPTPDVGPKETEAHAAVLDRILQHSEFIRKTDKSKPHLQQGANPEQLKKLALHISLGEADKAFQQVLPLLQKSPGPREDREPVSVKEAGQFLLDLVKYLDSAKAKEP
ncbi:unnamed protein product [Effrenium voratum]|uniref:Uncharacterized protein n=1 Tax=Effrenium voratum TaxID=2562239 RepID=A0AA36N0L1_9DINO|nr:unnamed protein product [Effrenium voratum]